MTLYTINEKFRAAPHEAAASTDHPPTDRMIRVAEMFGIGLDEAYEVALYEDFRIDIRPRDVVFITGPSGSGKSVLLRRIEQALRAEPGAQVVNLNDSDALPEADGFRAAGVGSRVPPTSERRPVIELMSSPLDESLRLLSAAGLADAFLLLRTPDELSDGQRYRLRLALALEKCGMRGAECGVENEKDAYAGSAASYSALRTPHSALSVLVADEFCSTLDRLCARAVAYRVRRLADRCGLTVVAAAANDDIVEDLAPDVLVTKHEGNRVEVRYADAARGVSTEGRES